MVAIVDGKSAIDEEVYKLVERVAFDTAIGFHLDLVQSIVEAGGKVGRDDLTKATDIPYTTLARALEDLVSLKVVEAHKTKKGRGQYGRGRPGIEYVVAGWVVDLWERASVSVDHTRRGRIARRRIAGNRVKVRRRVNGAGKGR